MSISSSFYHLNFFVSFFFMPAFDVILFAKSNMISDSTSFDSWSFSGQHNKSPSLKTHFYSADTFHLQMTIPLELFLIHKTTPTDCYLLNMEIVYPLHNHSRRAMFPSPNHSKRVCLRANYLLIILW